MAIKIQEIHSLIPPIFSSGETRRGRSSQSESRDLDSISRLTTIHWIEENIVLPQQISLTQGKWFTQAERSVWFIWRIERSCQLERCILRLAIFRNVALEMVSFRFRNSPLHMGLFCGLIILPQAEDFWTSEWILSLDLPSESSISRFCFSITQKISKNSQNKLT
jgi:hypothetical protein